MRCYQEIGLTPEAHEWIDKNANQVPCQQCPKCGEVITWKYDYRVYETQEMFYNDGPALKEFKLKDGRIAQEVVQCSPWSSGPMAFFCLEVENPDGTRERMFEWTDEEISHY